MRRIMRAFQKDSLLKKDGSLDVPQAVVSTIVLMAISLVLVYAEIRLLRSRTVSEIPLVRVVFDKLGYFGVALSVFLIDMFIVPLTVDMLWPFVMVWPAWEAILLMSLASALGGLGGYWIGRAIHKVPSVLTWTSNVESGSAYGKLLRKYGAMGVFLAGFTPIPYSTVCWISGVFNIKWKQVLAACVVSRTLRMVIYYFFVAMTN